MCNYSFLSERFLETQCPLMFIFCSSYSYSTHGSHEMPNAPYSCTVYFALTWCITNLAAMHWVSHKFVIRAKWVQKAQLLLPLPHSLALLGMQHQHLPGMHGSENVALSHGGFDKWFSTEFPLPSISQDKFCAPTFLLTQ